MFDKNIPTDKTKQEFFEEWRQHIDTKTTVPKNAASNDEFIREFHVFKSNSHAEEYFREKPNDKTHLFDQPFRQWDEEDKLIFGD